MLRTFLKRLFTPRGPALLAPRTLAPDFEVRDHRGRIVHLSDYRGQRVVLWFFPKASTPGCTKQGCGFRDSTSAYEAQGIAILGVSFDAIEDNRFFAEAYDFTFPLLCDVDRKIGLAYKACDSERDEYPRRITYVIGADGLIERAIATQNPGAQAGELLAAR